MCVCLFQLALEKKNSKRVCFDCGDVPFSLSESVQVRTERSSLLTCVLQPQTFFSQTNICVCRGECCLRFFMFVLLNV